MSPLALNKTRRCLCGNLRATSRALTQLYDEMLKPCGISITQFSLLSNIARNGPVAISQLAEILVMDQTTMTRNLQPLERQGFVQRTTGTDQRQRLLMLTEQGQAKLAEAYPLWEEAQAKVVDSLGQDRLKAMLKELTALTALAR